MSGVIRKVTCPDSSLCFLESRADLLLGTFLIALPVVGSCLLPAYHTGGPSLPPSSPPQTQRKKNAKDCKTLQNRAALWFKKKMKDEFLGKGVAWRKKETASLEKRNWQPWGVCEDREERGRGIEEKKIDTPHSHILEQGTDRAVPEATKHEPWRPRQEFSNGCELLAPELLTPHVRGAAQKPAF